MFVRSPPPSVTSCTFQFCGEKKKKKEVEMIGHYYVIAVRDEYFRMHMSNQNNELVPLAAQELQFSRVPIPS